MRVQMITYSIITKGRNIIAVCISHLETYLINTGIYADWMGSNGWHLLRAAHRGNNVPWRAVCPWVKAHCSVQLLQQARWPHNASASHSELHLQYIFYSARAIFEAYLFAKDIFKYSFKLTLFDFQFLWVIIICEEFCFFSWEFCFFYIRWCNV